MNTLAILGTVAAFGLGHSLAASVRFKKWARDTFGEQAFYGLYRLAYNLFAVLTLVPALLTLNLFTDHLLYTAPLPLGFLLVALQAIGALGVAVSLLAVDLSSFAGLRQFIALLRHDELPLPPGQLQIIGVYRLVRHPLYLFSLLFLWASPVMTRNLLFFNLAATVYFVVGTYPEERKLVDEFGEAYRTYQNHVPRLLPWPRP